ncbi:hypothetical protein BGY98DRAFT_992088, partial [Russula aff. rugulosa BPL654]
MAHPMSDRAWKRVEPLLLPKVNEARDRRPNQALASALAQNNGPNDPSVRSRFLEAINSLRPELETRKQGRASHLRSLLPEADKPGTFRPQLSDRGRETVKTLLQLLGLGEGTMALDLDRRNDKFVCIQCSRGSFIQGGKGVLGRCVRDWRSCIAHAISSKHERWNKCSPNWRVVTPTETAELIWEESSTAQAYGCLHCPTQIDPNRSTVQWYTAVHETWEVMEHVQIVHGRNNPLEGCDFFHDFRTRR